MRSKIVPYDTMSWVEKHELALEGQDTDTLVTDRRHHRIFALGGAVATLYFAHKGQDLLVSTQDGSVLDAMADLAGSAASVAAAFVMGQRFIGHFIASADVSDELWDRQHPDFVPQKPSLDNEDH